MSLASEERRNHREGRRLAESLASQERTREIYWTKYDHFCPERLAWRASISRHLLHLCPGQKILEIGAGHGAFTEELLRVTRSQTEITVVTFSSEYARKLKVKFKDVNIQVVEADQFPGALIAESFDCVIAHNMLDNQTRNLFLRAFKGLLKPGGYFLLFEINPWNPYYRLRRLVQALLPLPWKRRAEPVSLNRYFMYAVLSEIGYVNINALPYDFLYSPVPRFLMWPAKHLSLLMENCPYIRNLAGSLYIFAQKPFEGSGERVFPALTRHEIFDQKVSFVIPCRNEEMNIKIMVAGLKQCFDRYIQEIIIVDDNSTDHTALAAEELSQEDERIRLLRRTPPNGVGFALRDGLASSEGEFVMIMDSDFQNIIPEIGDLFDAVAEGADVAIGSRFSRQSVILNYPFTKIMVNRMFHVFMNVFLWGRIRYRDISNNLKLFRKQVVEDLVIESDDFAANAETGLKPLLQGYKVKEVPISWMNRSMMMGLSSFEIVRTGPNYVKLLFILIFRKWFRGFGKRKDGAYEKV